MSTTVAAATTATATVTSAGGTNSSTPSSTATTTSTSTSVSSTGTSSTPSATPGARAAPPGTPNVTPFGPGCAPFVTPSPSCLPESFTDSGDFENYLQQFNTTALLSGWFSINHENRPHYFALGLREMVLHFYTTLPAGQQADFILLVDAFRHNYKTNVDILKARLKAARQQTDQDTSVYLCDIRTPARRSYRAFPKLVEQIVLTSFNECLSDLTLRWELGKSKPATADDALALAMDLKSFLELERGAPSTSKAAGTSVNAIYREAAERSTKEWMDELVRNL